MQVLFGHHDADALFFHRQDRIDHLLDDFWRQPFEGSSSSTRDGLPISVRAIVSICCSPPLMRPPGRLRISPRFGNSVNSFFASPVRRVGSLRLLADLKVFLDRQIRENPALLRT